MSRASCLALVLVAGSASAQTIYRWTDARGEVHYTDDPSSAPKGARVETTEGEPVMVVPALPRPATSAPAPSAPKTQRRPRTNAVEPQAGLIEVTLAGINVEVSAPDRKYIEEAIRAGAASPRLAPWGPLRRSIKVYIENRSRMGDEAFGLAVGTETMLLLAPSETRAWGRALGYEQTVIHELAHLLEHQVAGMERPRWFAEGFASYVVGDTRSASLDDIAWWVLHEGGERPLERMFGHPRTCDTHVAYAIARQAIVYLVGLVGEDGLKRLFEKRGQGARFEAAFSDVTGLTLDVFQKQFAQSLKPHYYERATSTPR